MVKKRAILLILDSLGIGAMDDVVTKRPQDQQAHTFKHILDQAKQIRIPMFEALGMNQLLHHPRLATPSAMASWGALHLQHDGADSYAGHQEIMGTRPQTPKRQPFVEKMDTVKEFLEQHDYQVTIPNFALPYLWINEAVVVADNIETDYGQIYNVSAALDEISFDEVLNIGKIVRQVAEVNRVIALGGEGVTPDQLQQSIEQRPDGLVGVNSPKSGVYEKGYRARHFGLGVDPQKQVPTLLSLHQHDVHLIGKMQDVIQCDSAHRFPAVETRLVMQQILESMKNMNSGLIAATVQETDLAGHAEDVERYAQKIMEVDQFLEPLIRDMTDNDLLIISADHGNDPTIGHSQHTREKTFVLAYQPMLKAIPLGERSTLSDISASIAQFFNLPLPENGVGFYLQMKQ